MLLRQRNTSNNKLISNISTRKPKLQLTNNQQSMKYKILVLSKVSSFLIQAKKDLLVSLISWEKTISPTVNNTSLIQKTVSMQVNSLRNNFFRAVTLN